MLEGRVVGLLHALGGENRVCVSFASGRGVLLCHSYGAAMYGGCCKDA